MTLNEQYSELTINITKSLSKKEKKDFGIFITPKIIIEKLLDSQRLTVCSFIYLFVSI